MLCCKTGLFLLLFLGIFFIVGVDVATNFISSKLMSIRFGWSDEQVKICSSSLFPQSYVGALLGAFLLTRIAEMRYFRINIVACVVSLLVFNRSGKGCGEYSLYWCSRLFLLHQFFSIIYSMALQARPEKQIRFPV